jgi:hypothetical protein
MKRLDMTLQQGCCFVARLPSSATLSSRILLFFAFNRISLPARFEPERIVKSELALVIYLLYFFDQIALRLRLASHPEKREELMEWVLLSACLIVIALPLAMAAGGVAAAGVGAVVGGIAGSELGAALRAVMLLLIKEASKLVELVRSLQKFVHGDVLKFLRAVKFAKYEKALVMAVGKFTGKLVSMVRSLRGHLESLRYFDSVKSTIATLVAWEKKFYAVQQDALKQVPRALAELDARLGKVLSQTAPKEAHTVSSGVQAEKKAAAVPVKQRVRDTPGKVLPKSKPKAPAAPAKPKVLGAAKPKPKPKATPVAAADDVPLKDSPDPVKPPDDGANTKKQAVADAAVAADRERLTQLSNEAREAQKNGDTALAAAKIEEGRAILRPHLPKGPNDSWDKIVKRLDVASPENGAVFWSGDPKAAQKFAEGINGVTLETTSGGRFIDEWDEVNKGYTWDARYGDPPYARDLWKDVSKKYAEGATGNVSAVQSIGKLSDSNTLWHNVEKPVIQTKMMIGEVSDLDMYKIGDMGDLTRIGDAEVNDLLKLKGTAP